MFNCLPLCCCVMRKTPANNLGNKTPRDRYGDGRGDECDEDHMGGYDEGLGWWGYSNCGGEIGGGG